MLLAEADVIAARHGWQPPRPAPPSAIPAAGRP
jgi:hypothetical protein